MALYTKSTNFTLTDSQPFGQLGLRSKYSDVTSRENKHRSGNLCLIDLAAVLLGSTWPQVTSRPKPPICQLFLGYKELWQTIAGLQQVLRAQEKA